MLHLTLVSFAVTRRAYQRITELFAKSYKEKTGYTVRFRLSFGGSGTQVRPSSFPALLRRNSSGTVGSCIDSCGTVGSCFDSCRVAIRVCALGDDSSSE